MRNFQSSEIVLAVRKLLTEMETEYPDMTPNEMRAFLFGSIENAAVAIATGRTPNEAVQFALCEAQRLKQIPPW